MSRISRNELLYDGCYAHVISRSIRKIKLFADLEDFDKFKSLLLMAPILLAFLFMDNVVVPGATITEQNYAPIQKPNYTRDMTDEKLIKEYEKSYLGEHPIATKYFLDVLYVGMPEEEFVNKFTKNASYEGTARPYIFKKTRNVYHVIYPKLPYLPDPAVSRITFKDGKLIKYEYRYWDKPPFVMYVYSDITRKLKIKEGDKLVLQKDNPNYFIALSEKEMLDEISSSDFFTIISKKVSKSGNLYVIEAKTGAQWKIKFYPEGGMRSQEYIKP